MVAFGKVCPACSSFVDAGATCSCRRQRDDGRVATGRRLALEQVWNSPRWREISRRVCTAARKDAGCVDCGTKHDLVADHVDGFDGPDDPRAFDENNVVARCRTCSGKKDGARPRPRRR